MQNKMLIVTDSETDSFLFCLLTYLHKILQKVDKTRGDKYLTLGHERVKDSEYFIILFSPCWLQQGKENGRNVK